MTLEDKDASEPSSVEASEAVTEVTATAVRPAAPTQEAPARTGAPVPPEGLGEAVASTASGASASTPDESAPKKPVNKKVVIGIVAAAVVLVGVGAFLFARGQAANAGRLAIHESAEKIVSADQELVELDRYADLDYFSLTLSDPSAMDDTFSSATDSLDAAQEALDGAKSSEWALDGADKDAIAALQSSVDARRHMVEVGRKVVDSLGGAYSASKSITSYYSGLNDFQTSVGDAISVVNAASDVASIDSARFKSDANDAKQHASALVSDISAAKAAVPSADFSKFQTVADKSSSLADLLNQLSAAIASGDASSVNSIAQTFNSDKNELAAAITKTETLSDLVDMLVTDEDKSLAADYQSARDAAVASLEPLSSYTGIDLSDLTKGSSLLD
ncbi:hypothetical protein HMPREF1008_01111 [Olsenella sp. oral taxon 809 str. F0356]|uniref:hypothetical protein n=1 Tax=Olsenella sp. oral taxon 809 TaxID=661086 RepID=UPI000231EDFA|nr:hypothetical protein [Olsenella sp. oral taxon 809]EHF02016.1 hypothetical protein HMPREF1008_01111 [Olsenella sp. oral taxon 809 str. F0356]